MTTDSNSSLSTYRTCARKYELRYELQLDPEFRDAEALDVGSCWHGAKEAGHRYGTAQALDSIDRTAPSPLWRETLRRLFVAHEWYWKADTFWTFEAAEIPIAFEWRGFHYRGKVDAVVRDSSGRMGLLEYKTTSQDLSPGSDFWRAKLLDVQVGMYGLGLSVVNDHAGNGAGLPDFIVYDVVRKPTIKPAKIKRKADLERIVAAATTDDLFDWCGESITPEDAAIVECTGTETLAMYGARLTQDIGARPSFYFARHPIDRTTQDYMVLLAELESQSETIQSARERGSYPRNPDACVGRFGECEFFRICSQNIHPQAGHVPEGFRVREHRHPELDGATT